MNRPIAASAKAWTRRLGIPSAFLAVLAIFLGTAVARAQAPVSVSTPVAPIAFSTNNTGSNLTYALNLDSSVSVLKTTGFVSGAGCPAFVSGTLSNAAIYFDPSTKRLYIATSVDTPNGTGGGTVVTYETVNGNGTCAPGPSVTISPFATFNLELTVDSSLGAVYVLAGTDGATPDSLFVMTVASFPTYALPNATIPQVFLDYSATYGPIVVDSFSHRVYVNDFGIAANYPAGLNPSPGFFVYDPNHSATVSNNVEHVLGYVNSSNGNVPFNAQTLLVDGTGKLILVNQNTTGLNGNTLGFLSTPFTVLDPTKFNFFTNAVVQGGGFSTAVYLQPGTGISLVNAPNGATLVNYYAYSSADLDTAHGIIYVFAYDAANSGYNFALVQSSGVLLTYNLATKQESAIAQNLGFAALPESSNVAPWDRMTFNPAASDLVLTASNGALGVTSPLSNCGLVTVTQVLGGGATFLQLGAPALNSVSGYVYDTETIYPNTALYYVAPNTSCNVTSLTISPSTLADGVAGVSYGSVTIFADSDGQSFAGTTFSATGLPPGMTLSRDGIFSGTPTVTGPFEVTITATAPGGATGTATIPLQINCPTITITSSPLPGGVLGVPYGVVFTETGGVGTVTFQAFGPFAPGVPFNGTGLSGIPGLLGAYPIGVQATDSNGCKSINTVSILNIATPQFKMSPALNGQCGKGVTGFPIGIPPVVSINGINYFQVQLNLWNSGNVAAIANLTSANLGVHPPVNPSAPGAAPLPIIFNNPGTEFPVGGCVALSLYYPLSDWTTLQGVVNPLRLQGTFTTDSNPAVSGNWSLTDARVILGNSVTSGGGPGTSD